jgi:hypothetical protein
MFPPPEIVPLRFPSGRAVEARILPQMPFGESLLDFDMFANIPRNKIAR